MKGVSYYSLWYYIVCLLVVLLAHGSVADDYDDDNVGVILSQISRTLIVDLHGRGEYTTVQSAINAVPFENQHWIRILIRSGIYKEKVTIPKGKGYVLMQGGGIEKTIIDWSDHQVTDTSATFTAYPNNIFVTKITFKNTYNIASMPFSATPLKPALAARMLGDKYAVIDSSFDGYQDTLFDCLGRHYYKRCVISGGVDFIFGYAQSHFEGCTLNITVGNYEPNKAFGTITAHGRQSPAENGGFVFKGCTVTGKGKVLLGRPWEPYARVIFYDSNLSDVILPIGWGAWTAKGQEEHTTFVEVGCTGAGADMSHRVPWLKKLSESDIRSLTDISFINQDGWINKLPIKF